MEKIHHYRPEFICGTLTVPSYYTAENASHYCSHTSKSCGPKLNFLSADDVDDLESDVHIICGDWPYVHPGLLLVYAYPLVAFEAKAQAVCSSS
jgi:hypothetical protein